jgi:hypothetical protein
MRAVRVHGIRKEKSMRKDVPKDLDFLEKLNQQDRERFYHMTAEQRRETITENKLAHEEEKLEEENAAMSQLTDRIASKNFQG